VTTVIAVAPVLWARYARVIRGEILRLNNLRYVMRRSHERRLRPCPTYSVMTRRRDAGGEIALVMGRVVERAGMVNSG
jgi:hypothetical protein